ncbi:MAG: hypothetical protein OFPII_12130 [Osedax symbiont Rs1]|nr:MAG: hypothetical protein OFPII_12130 [Osedax symbiont Rs1]
MYCPFAASNCSIENYYPFSKFIIIMICIGLAYVYVDDIIVFMAQGYKNDIAFTAITA